MLSFYHAVCAPDNVLILAIRSAGPPLVLYRHSDHPQVFSQLDQTYLAHLAKVTGPAEDTSALLADAARAASACRPAKRKSR